MGNAVGGRKRVKVMKINGETLKLKTPIKASDVLKDYPTYVLLESDSVKRFGVRATPLEPQQELKPKKIYFLLQLPKLAEEKVPRRVRSGVHMNAKERLECLMLSRRTVSDLTIVRPPPNLVADGSRMRNSGPLKVKMRLPKAEVAKIVEESKDGADVAEKIINLYMERTGDSDGVGTSNGGRVTGERREKQVLHGSGGNSKSAEKFRKACVTHHPLFIENLQNHVSFMPIDEVKFN